MEIQIQNGDSISLAIKRKLIENGVAANDENFSKASIWTKVMNTFKAEDAEGTISHNGTTRSIGSEWDTLKKKVIVHAGDVIQIAETTWNKILEIFGVNVQTPGGGGSADGQGAVPQGGNNTPGGGDSTVVDGNEQGAVPQGGNNTPVDYQGLSKEIKALKTTLLSASYDKDDVKTTLTHFNKVLVAENENDSTFINDLIKNTADLDGELALVICKQIDISKLGPQQKTELQNLLVNILPNKEISILDINSACMSKNGWIDKADIKGTRHGNFFVQEEVFITGELECTFGGKTFRAFPSSTSDKCILREINKDHAEMGVQLFADVVGTNGSNSDRHKDAKKIIAQIDENNVIEVIRSFNMASNRKHGVNHTGMFRYMWNEEFLNGEDFSKISKSLAKAVNNLDGNIAASFPAAPVSGVTLGYLNQLDEWCKENIK